MSGLLVPSGWPSPEIVSERYEGDIPRIVFGSAACKRQQRGYGRHPQMHCRASLGGIFSAIGPDRPRVSENSQKKVRNGLLFKVLD